MGEKVRADGGFVKMACKRKGRCAKMAGRSGERILKLDSSDKRQVTAHDTGDSTKDI
ncbi:hypothetical protein F220043C3_45310 [Enterocloster asparagiformis]